MPRPNLLIAISLTIVFLLASCGDGSSSAKSETTHNSTTEEAEKARKEKQRQAEEKQRQAEEKQRQAEEKQRQAKEKQRLRSALERLEAELQPDIETASSIRRNAMNMKDECRDHGLEEHLEKVVGAAEKILNFEKSSKKGEVRFLRLELGDTVHEMVTLSRLDGDEPSFKVKLENGRKGRVSFRRLPDEVLSRLGLPQKTKIEADLRKRRGIELVKKALSMKDRSKVGLKKAYSMYVEAASLGHSDAPFLAGVTSQEIGQGFDESCPPEFWFRKAIEVGDKETGAYFGDFLLRSTSREKRTEGERLLREFIAKGDDSARFVLGRHLISLGKVKEGRAFLDIAGRKIPAAKLELGIDLFRSNDSVQSKWGEVLLRELLFSKTRSAGRARAELVMAMYHGFHGREKNIEEAMRLCRECNLEKQSYVIRGRLLSVMADYHYSGTGENNHNKAYLYVRKGIMTGDPVCARLYARILMDYKVPEIRSRQSQLIAHEVGIAWLKEAAWNYDFEALQMLSSLDKELLGSTPRMILRYLNRMTDGRPSIANMRAKLTNINTLATTLMKDIPAEKQPMLKEIVDRGRFRHSWKTNADNKIPKHLPTVGHYWKLETSRGQVAGIIHSTIKAIIRIGDTKVLRGDVTDKKLRFLFNKRLRVFEEMTILNGDWDEAFASWRKDVSPKTVAKIVQLTSLDRQSSELLFRCLLASEVLGKDIKVQPTEKLRVNITYIHPDVIKRKKEERRLTEMAKNRYRGHYHSYYPGSGHYRTSSWSRMSRFQRQLALDAINEATTRGW